MLAKSERMKKTAPAPNAPTYLSIVLRERLPRGNWELGPNGIGETVLRSFGSGIKCPFFIGPNGVPNVMRLRTISEAQGWQLVHGRARPIFPWASPGQSSQFTG